MKLATYKDGSRDGQLVVVSRDLSSAHFAAGIATRLQQVLDDWNFLSPQLEDLSSTLNMGKARHAFPFDPRMCMAPLPRAHLWVSARATRASGGQADAQPPAPAAAASMAQHPGDHFLGPVEALRLPAGVQALGVEARLAVATGDLAAGADAEQALESIRLLLLACCWSPIGAGPVPEAGEGGDGGDGGEAPVPGLGDAHLATSFAPLAVTPDELGEAWRAGQLGLPLRLHRQGRPAGSLAAAEGPGFAFGALVAQQARWRALRAGSLVGSAPWRATAASRPLTVLRPLNLGDGLRLDCVAADGQAVFGSIELQLGGEPPPAEADAPAGDAVDAAAPTADPAP